MSLLAYTPEIVDENKLLFQLAKYNFTNFLVRNFDITTDTQTLYTDSTETSLRRMIVSGFLSYDEVLQYVRQLYSETSDGRLAEMLRQCRCIVVSEANLAQLGTRISYEEYMKFYEETFAPMSISQEQLLTIPEAVEQPDIEDIFEDEDEEEEETPQQDPGGFDFDEDFF